MILKEIPFNPESTLFSLDRERVRSEGLHVSTIITDLDKTLNAQNYRNEFDEDQLNVYGTLGFVWERVFSEIYSAAFCEGRKNTIISPGEIEHDGIFGTCDGIDIDEQCIIELKCTWRSSNRPIEQDFSKWFWQMKFYCLAWGLEKARLGVFWVNGNYQGTRNVPSCSMWGMEFTQQELEKNNLMLRAHARGKGWL